MLHPQNSSSPPGDRRPRRRTVGVAIAALALVAGSLGWTASSGAQSGESFVVSDYGSGVSLSIGAYCWRGYAFELNVDLEVTALIGGGETDGEDVSFLGAIWAGELTGEVELLLESVVAEVTFPDGPEQVVTLAEPVTLSAGQTYLIGMGISDEEFNEDNVGMYAVDGYDGSAIAGPDGLFSEWIAPSDTDAIFFEAGDLDCYGAPQSAVGNVLITDDATTTNPAIGFDYEATPGPTTTTSPEPTTTTTPGPGPAPTTPDGQPVTPRFTG